MVKTPHSFAVFRILFSRRKCLRHHPPKPPFTIVPKHQCLHLRSFHPNWKQCNYSWWSLHHGYHTRVCNVIWRQWGKEMTDDRCFFITCNSFGGVSVIPLGNNQQFWNWFDYHVLQIPLANSVHLHVFQVVSRYNQHSKCCLYFYRLYKNTGNTENTEARATHTLPTSASLFHGNVTFTKTTGSAKWT